MVINNKFALYVLVFVFALFVFALVGLLGLSSYNARVSDLEYKQALKNIKIESDAKISDMLALKCISGKFEIKTSSPDLPFDTATIGEQVICARDWHISNNIYGPTVEDYLLENGKILIEMHKVPDEIFDGSKR